MREYIGVYNADGGLSGEVRYIVGHLLGRVECALCDITHSPVRRKREWDDFVAGLGVPFRLYHLNEMPAEVAQVVAEVGSPVVMVRDPDLRVVAGPGELAAMGGSVAALRQWLARPTAPPR